MTFLVPEVIIESFDLKLAEVMKPINFDAIWNAAGYGLVNH